MNKILVLIDFTDISKKTLQQSVELARLRKADLILCHILNSKSGYDEVKLQLEEFLDEAQNEGVKAEVLIEEGEFIECIPNVVRRIRPKLVVVGTHGKKGWKQHLLGSNILKLVKILPTPTLVINEVFTVAQGGFKNILLPVAPHNDYIIKVKQSAALLAEGGKVLIFNIVKPGVEIEQQTINNIEEGQKFLDEQHINWEYREIDSSTFSVGYSRETLDYAANNQVDLIGIMTKVSEENRHYGNIDKENLLINENGIAILCSNS